MPCKSGFEASIKLPILPKIGPTMAAGHFGAEHRRRGVSAVAQHVTHRVRQPLLGRNICASRPPRTNFAANNQQTSPSRIGWDHVSFSLHPTPGFRSGPRLRPILSKRPGMPSACNTERSIRRLRGCIGPPESHHFGQPLCPPFLLNAGALTGQGPGSRDMCDVLSAL